MTESAVIMERVSKTFGQHRAVDGLDLVVPRGSVYGFIGPNGSGKTTTLRLILRIFRPEQGRISVLGRERGHAADERLGYLPEERGLYKRMKVFRLLQYHARLKGRTDCDSSIADWLKKLDAWEWRDRRIDTLSKGMAQKIQFLSAVVAKPELLILDEPFSGLDPVNMECLRDAVLSLRDMGTTILFSTHDMAMAGRMCDTIFMIFRGRKVLDGTLSEIQKSYAIERLRIRLSGQRIPESLDGASRIIPDGSEFLVEPAPGTDPQAILHQLLKTDSVEFFETMRPSLHDIFVSIANEDGPGGETCKKS